MKRSRFILFLILSSNAYAQNTGVLSGGFQSDTQWYQDDQAIRAFAPREKLASNNYLKVDYAINNFTFGIRYEAYLPPLLGYQQQYEGTGITNKYASFHNDILEVTAGNFYEQFGSGLILRTYEERQLGVDNSLDGFRVKISPVEGVDLTGVYGKQRKFFEPGNGTVRGIDGNIHINKIFNWENSPFVGVGISAVSKYELYTGPNDDINENVNAYSARASLVGSKMSFDAEYVQKDIDPSESNALNTIRKGRAILINSGFFKKGIGINLTLRRLENMDFRSERTASLTNLWINYLPAETRQHGYLLPNIYPYAVQAQGEIGGQVNVNYTFAKKSKLGGKYGTKIALNYSQYNKLQKEVNHASSTANFNTELFQVNDTIIYRDANIELKKKVNKNFTTTLSFISIEYNKVLIEGNPGRNINSQIGVVETLFKFPKRRSVRMELQHLWTKEDNGNWAAGLLEYSIAPKWSFFAMDQYNYGSGIRIHYYQAGFSFKKDATQITTSYGRQRGGLICVGGVCRLVPTASGANLSIVTNF